MIKSFGCVETEKIWDGTVSKKFPYTIQQTARRKLVHINSALDRNDLKVPPGNRLKYLSGDLINESSIRIYNQWRITFIWKNGNALAQAGPNSPRLFVL